MGRIPACKMSSEFTHELTVVLKYRKNSETKPRGLYFSKALFERLIFGRAHIRRDLSTEGKLRFKIDWASLLVGT